MAVNPHYRTLLGRVAEAEQRIARLTALRNRYVKEASDYIASLDASDPHYPSVVLARAERLGVETTDLDQELLHAEKDLTLWKEELAFSATPYFDGGVMTPHPRRRSSD